MSKTKSSKPETNPADGKSSSKEEAQEDKRATSEKEDTTDDNSKASEENDDSKSNKRGLLLPLAAICLVGQLIITWSLKNDNFTDHLIPKLQKKIDDGLKWPHLNQSLFWQRLNQSLAASNVTEEDSRPGFQLAKEGAEGQYPVVMIPGFVTSGLEVWKGTDCAKEYFRTRLWGGVGSVQHWLMERHCVMEHLALHPVTGKDPDGIRLRAGEGFQAADYFMGNYWVWGKILENLADVGYDGSTMSMETYDWRLSFPKLEERDGYLTKLKYRIEAFHSSTGKKVILASHSLGAMLVHYFFGWVSEQDKDWVDKYIHTYVNIAGSQLGVPKAASALLSGEMSDTIIKGPVGTLLEQFLSRKARRTLFASWGSLYHMLPKGGDERWDSLISMTDGEGNPKNSSENGDEFSVDEQTSMEEAIQSFASQTNHSASKILDFLIKLGGGYQQEKAEKAWHDASKSPLPNAPNMKIYCLYGVGRPTEVGYFYKRNQDDTGEEDGGPAFIVDTCVEDDENDIIHGVKYADGDGSVPLSSLGYMCAEGWRSEESELNPANIPVVTREYQHKDGEFSVEDPMGRGPYSGDHVDILGHMNMLTDLVKIVTDRADDVTDKFISDIGGRRKNEEWDAKEYEMLLNAVLGNGICWLNAPSLQGDIQDNSGPGKETIFRILEAPARQRQQHLSCSEIRDVLVTVAHRTQTIKAIFDLVEICRLPLIKNRSFIALNWTLFSSSTFEAILCPFKSSLQRQYEPHQAIAILFNKRQASEPHQFVERTQRGVDITTRHPIRKVVPNNNHQILFGNAHT
eukprot:scaffold2597_cov116-Cylindrotheca_fusiformis.AAC.6